MTTSGDCNSKQQACQSEEIAAYLDGELEASAATLFERHLTECAACARALQEQRRLLCALDFAFGGDRQDDIVLPQNFSQIVTIQAQSDLRNVRSEQSERRRALRLCLLLMVVSFALLGGAVVSESILKPLGLLLRHTGALVSFGWNALYNFGAGIAVIARAAGGHALFESHRFAALVSLLLIIAVILLPRLISSYHRTHVALEEGAPRR